MNWVLVSSDARGTGNGGLGHISQAFSPLGGEDFLAEATGCFEPLQLLLAAMPTPKPHACSFLLYV